MPVRVLPIADDTPEPVRRFLDNLSAEQKMLLVLKRELYDGDWRPMIADLRNRLDGRPYVVRLAGRITDDLDRIEQMRKLEQRHRLDLASYLEVPTDTETPV